MEGGREKEKEGGKEMIKAQDTPWVQIINGCQRGEGRSHRSVIMAQRFHAHHQLPTSSIPNMQHLEV